MEEEKHNYRAIAAPKNCYVDKRIDKLLEINRELAHNLFNNKKEHWAELVSRCIDVYNNLHNPTPKALFIEEYNQMVL